uniref:Polg2 protein n=1 Tax=Fopius arisanus TaxID=64838 RepID=A0A0C9RMJ2_9HYME
MTLEKILEDVGSAFLKLERGFLFGPQGRLLRRNVEELWYRYCVVMPPYNVFLSAIDGMSETLGTLQRVGAGEKPFGIAALEESKSCWNGETLSEAYKLPHRVGRVTVVASATEGKDLFHRKQRERKVWWRKFSREPKRFQFAEAKRSTKNKEIIDIEAHFSFGKLLVESISHQQDVKRIFKDQNVSDKSLENVHIVEHTASLDWGSLAFLCDAYTPRGISGTCQVKLHPKFSPYKVGFHVCENVDSKSLEKSRLLLYLNNLVKAEGIETVVTTSKIGMESLQVPLVVHVDETTLQNGIVKVWSQLTTLHESVHITDLTKYVSSRCN